jgi:hypothetical protein
LDYNARAVKDHSSRKEILRIISESTPSAYSVAKTAASDAPLHGSSSTNTKPAGLKGSMRNTPKDFEQYFQGLYDEARDILVQRQAQYGPANIESLGIPGVFSRMSDDKMSRIKKALSGEFVKGRVVLSKESLKELQHPSVRDALMDAANYCLILVSLIESEWSNLELNYDPDDGAAY